MEIVKHLWNVNQFMTKLKSPMVKDLQIFYMQKCKKFSHSVELPQKNFGSSVTCSYCGSLWSTVDHKVRILSGKRMSRSVRKIVKHMNENPDQRNPKVRATLAHKSIQNEMSKLVIKCSVCSKNTKVPFKKTSHLKPVKLNNSQIETPQSNRKKKKKKCKDKTAGLNITACTSVQANKKNNYKISTPSPAIISKTIQSKKSSASPKKSKKFNIERLKRIMENNVTTPTKKNNLHNFLTEIY
ncbi:hypothetical protein PUN28_017193 [Cardiocondyla obscurior]|uniref:Uncharacterized protein n=1 Tax=Cardiocondyla obscurior TaxID=286306 RepID=A0AAW2EKN3_9HYME